MSGADQARDAEAFEHEELVRSSYDLADFFNGVVLDGQTYKRVPRPSILPPHYLHSFRPQSEPVLIGDVELCPYAAEPDLGNGRIQLNVFAAAARRGPIKLSLTQIRAWYTIAKALQRPTAYLARIAAIGHQFKQTYGEAAPDKLEPFNGWHDQEVEQWLWDVSIHEQRSTAAANASIVDEPTQMDLFG